MHGFLQAGCIAENERVASDCHHAKTSDSAHRDDLIANLDHDIDLPGQFWLMPDDPRGHPRQAWLSVPRAYGTRARVLMRSSSLRAERDDIFMMRAIALARSAGERQEVPIGSIVVMDDEVIGEGHNCPVTSFDPTAHAEIMALRAAAVRIGNYRLSGADLFVTAEPCLMCLGALANARIRRVVFGCPEPKTGALGSRFDFRLLPGSLPGFEVIGGVKARECGDLLKQFFRTRRGA